MQCIVIVIVSRCLRLLVCLFVCRMPSPSIVSTPHARTGVGLLLEQLVQPPRLRRPPRKRRQLHGEPRGIASGGCSLFVQLPRPLLAPVYLHHRAPSCCRGRCRWWYCGCGCCSDGACRPHGDRQRLVLGIRVWVHLFVSAPRSWPYVHPHPPSTSTPNTNPIHKIHSANATTHSPA